MGQGQGREAERGKAGQRPGRPAGGAGGAAGGPARGVRTAAYSDALVSPPQATHHHSQPADAAAARAQSEATTTGPTAPAPAPAAPSSESNARSRSTSQQASTVGSRHGSVDPSGTLPGGLGESSASAEPNPAVVVSNLVPVVVRFLDPSRIKGLLESKPQVYLASEYSGWKPTIQMCPSEDSFYCIAQLPTGENRVRFIVNGEPFLDASQPTSSVNGVPANVVTASDVLLLAHDEDAAADDGRDWGQEEFAFEETRKYPPMLPPHLRYTPLNTPPTQIRCARDGTMNIAGQDSLLDPEHLPLPLSVTINHVYLQRRDDHTVLGMTTRYGSKFTTVVYYKSIPPQAA
jgi:hypothetical protein